MKTDELSTKQQKRIFNKKKISNRDFDQIYKIYFQKVYDFTLKRVSDEHVAEDLTSTIFEKIVKSLKDFQWQGITVSAWIFRIARNQIIDHYRKNNKYKGRVSLNEVSNFIESKDIDTLSLILDNEVQVKLYNSIREFKDEDQYLIFYKFFEGFNNKKIAKLMHMTETNIGTRLHRIRKKLKSLMKEEV